VLFHALKVNKFKSSSFFFKKEKVYPLVYGSKETPTEEKP
jgi:hypothetical protein